MASLLIVRHAQASFMAEDYDQLSALGETQARLLGELWVGGNVRLDRVACGPRERQKRTVEIIAATYKASDHPFPAIEIYPEFDEYHAEAVMSAALPVLLQSDEAVCALQSAFTNAFTAEDRRLSFQRLFEHVITQWVRNDLQLDNVESWAEFCARVNSGFDHLLASQVRSEKLALFSSAGPLAVALQRALDLSPETTLQMSWMPRNASWSEFLTSTNKFTLSSFNTYSHLSDPTYLTYR